MHDASRANGGALSSTDDLFPPAVRILAAADDAGRARILLRLSDMLIVSHVEELVSACRQAGFGLGLGYLQFRFRTLAATRDVDGTLPAEQVYSLAQWRSDLFDLTVNTP